MNHKTLLAAAKAIRNARQLSIHGEKASPWRELDARWQRGWLAAAKAAWKVAMNTIADDFDAMLERDAEVEKLRAERDSALTEREIIKDQLKQALTIPNREGFVDSYRKLEQERDAALAEGARKDDTLRAILDLVGFNDDRPHDCLPGGKMICCRAARAISPDSGWLARKLDEAKRNSSTDIFTIIDRILGSWPEAEAEVARHFVARVKEAAQARARKP